MSIFLNFPFLFSHLAKVRSWKIFSICSNVGENVCVGGLEGVRGEREKQRQRESTSELATCDCAVTVSVVYSTDQTLLGTTLRLGKVWFGWLKKCYSSDVCIT